MSGLAENLDLSFGRIAVRAKLLSEKKLEALLEEQRDLRARNELITLGELCQRRGALTSDQVQKILLAQEFYRMRQEDELLAAIIEKKKLAGRDEIKMALDEQIAAYQSENRVPQSLGDILVEMGALDHAALAGVRAEYPDLKKAVQRRKTEIVRFGEPNLAEPDKPTGWLLQEGGEGKGRVFPIRQKALLGRDPANEVPFEDKWASRQHARVEWDTSRGKHLLVDLNTINGTSLNGKKVKDQAPLAPGDRIRVGDAIFRYDVKEPQPEQPLQPAAPSAQAPVAPSAKAPLAPPPARSAIPASRKVQTVHRPRPPQDDEDIPVAEVVSPSPLANVIPLSAVIDRQRSRGGADVRIKLQQLVDQRLAGKITEEEYFRRRQDLLERL
ncbi:MAG: FHA domain-containing protein [Planctomycetota bacterium]